MQKNVFTNSFTQKFNNYMRIFVINIQCIKPIIDFAITTLGSVSRTAVTFMFIFINIY